MTPSPIPEEESPAHPTIEVWENGIGWRLQRHANDWPTESRLHRIIKQSTTPSPLTEQIGGSHYKSLAIQPAEYAQRNKLGFLEGNVVRYVTRHQAKGGDQDIEKAIHCLRLLLEIEYGSVQHIPIPAGHGAHCNCITCLTKRAMGS